MPAGLYSPIGYSGTIGGGLGITENSRLDNSLRYDNKIGDVSFGSNIRSEKPIALKRGRGFGAGGNGRYHAGP